MDLATVIRSCTVPTRLPLLPELNLRLADPRHSWWQHPDAWNRAWPDAPEAWWAFAWAGGQALARWVLDHPELVQHRRVLCFAAGCGVEAVAAARAGAGTVIATELDPRATTLIAEQADAHAVAIDVRLGDVVDAWHEPIDVVLAGDVCYDQVTSARIVGWLRRLAGNGVDVYLGDPGRTWLPRQGITPVARYHADVGSPVEDNAVRDVRVFRLLPAEPPP